MPVKSSDHYKIKKHDLDPDVPSRANVGDGVGKPQTMGEMIKATMREAAGLDSGMADSGKPMDVAGSSTSEAQFQKSPSGRVPGNDDAA